MHLLYPVPIPPQITKQTIHQIATGHKWSISSWISTFPGEGVVIIKVKANISSTGTGLSTVTGLNCRHCSELIFRQSPGNNFRGHCFRDDFNISLFFFFSRSVQFQLKSDWDYPYTQLIWPTSQPPVNIHCHWVGLDPPRTPNMIMQLASSK